MNKKLFLLPLLVLGLAACGKTGESNSVQDSVSVSVGGDTQTTAGGSDTATSTPAPQNLIATYDFTTLTGTGTEITDPASVLGGLGTAITWTSATKVYNGGGAGGAHANGAGLLKFGTGSVNGELAFTVSENVSRVVLGCHSFYASSEQYPTNDTNFVTINDMTAVAAPYNATGTSEDVTFDLAAATNSITIKTYNPTGADKGGRIYLFTLSLYK